MRIKQFINKAFALFLSALHCMENETAKEAHIYRPYFVPESHRRIQATKMCTTKESSRGIHIMIYAIAKCK